eukprot:2713544-Lingulodinium_polyedra.AAC.1
MGLTVCCFEPLELGIRVASQSCGVSAVGDEAASCHGGSGGSDHTAGAVATKPVHITLMIEQS